MASRGAGTKESAPCGRTRRNERRGVHETELIEKVAAEEGMKAEAHKHFEAFAETAT